MMLQLGVLATLGRGVGQLFSPGTYLLDELIAHDLLDAPPPTHRSITHHSYPSDPRPSSSTTVGTLPPPPHSVTHTHTQSPTPTPLHPYTPTPLHPSHSSGAADGASSRGLSVSSSSGTASSIQTTPRLTWWQQLPGSRVLSEEERESLVRQERAHVMRPFSAPHEKNPTPWQTSAVAASGTSWLGIGTTVSTNGTSTHGTREGEVVHQTRSVTGTGAGTGTGASGAGIGSVGPGGFVDRGSTDGWTGMILEVTKEIWGGWTRAGPSVEDLVRDLPPVQGPMEERKKER